MRKNLINCMPSGEKEDTWQLKTQGYLLMHLLIASSIMPLWYGYLLRKQLIKSVKLTTGHFRWFTTNIINHTKNFFNSTIMSLFIKDTCNIWFWKIFKSLIHLNQEFLWSCLHENSIPYDLRKEPKVFLPPVKSFRLGLNSVHFRWSALWNSLPSSIKNSQTTNEFKAKLKYLGNIHCACGGCRWDLFYIF